MALSLGVRKGMKISVGGHVVKVLDLLAPNLIVISVDDGEKQVVSEQASTEILPDVTVFSGVGQHGLGNRLAFEAPRHIQIVRQEA